MLRLAMPLHGKVFVKKLLFVPVFVTALFALWVGVSGAYSFLVPPGTYSLSAVAPGYKPYQGENFTVVSGSGIHKNIELSSKYAWISVLDWKAVVLLGVVILLVLNFYRDRNREKLLRNK